MPLMDIANELVALCLEQKNLEAVEKFYSPDIVSIEPCAMDDMPPRVQGLDAIRAKHAWWVENNEVHDGTIKGPFPHGEDRFALYFEFDITNKPSNTRMKLQEVGLYTVKDGKIVQEEFFYDAVAAG